MVLVTTTTPPLNYLRDEHLSLVYKLARANQHSKVLFDSMRDYSDPNPIRLKEVRRDGRIYVNVVSVEPPPLRRGSSCAIRKSAKG